MQLVSFHVPQGIHFGVRDGAHVVDLVDAPHAVGLLRTRAPRSILELLALGPAGIDAAARAAAKALKLGECLRRYGDVRLAAPIPRPGKLLALAGNYGEHLRESGHTWAEKGVTTPRLFMKPATSVTGPYDPIIYPPNANKIDWEGELGVVIGRRARLVSAAAAMDYVAGYLVVNDVSERSLKVETAREGDKWFDWLNGKWFDTFAPMGPALVLKDEVPDPHALRLVTRVNGTAKQEASTGQMIFDIAELIEWASRWMTLEPGDIISTGTPAGVGSASGTFLKPRDVVEVEISSIGKIRNVVTPMADVAK